VIGDTNHLNENRTSFVPGSAHPINEPPAALLFKPSRRKAVVAPPVIIREFKEVLAGLELEATA
jgi:hypothetical protein